MGEQRAGAAGPLSGACIDDNPLSAFLFSHLSSSSEYFSQAVVVLFERARDRKNKAHHFPNNGEKIDEKSVFSRISRFVDAIIIRDRFCR